VNALNNLKKFARKDYRDGFLRTQIGSGIAYQIQALRAKLGVTQQEFAELTGKKQTVISRLENSRSGLVTVRTLLDIATGANVALLVRFVSYPEFLGRTADMSDAALQPETISESLENALPWAGSAVMGVMIDLDRQTRNQWLTQDATRNLGSVIPATTTLSNEVHQTSATPSRLPSLEMAQ
jgi:transcriptional regulator with XRE-family HTH domain